MKRILNTSLYLLFVLAFAFGGCAKDGEERAQTPLELTLVEECVSEFRQAYCPEGTEAVSGFELSQCDTSWTPIEEDEGVVCIYIEDQGCALTCAELVECELGDVEWSYAHRRECQRDGQWGPWLLCDDLEPNDPDVRATR